MAYQNFMSSLGNALRRLREKRKLTQRDVASHLRWSQPTICLIENGAQQPSIKQLKSLCKLYDVSLANLMERHG